MATTQDIHAPTLGAQGEPCASCGAPLAGDQRYCLECGARRAQARVAVPRHPGRRRRAAGAARAARRAAAPEGPPARSGLAFLAGLLCLLAALGVGVLIGNSGDDSTAATPPPAGHHRRRRGRGAGRDRAGGDHEHAAPPRPSAGASGSSAKSSKGSRLLGEALEGLGGGQQEGQGPQLELGRGLPEEVPEAPQGGRDLRQAAAQGQQARRRRHGLPGHRMSALTDRFRDRRGAAPPGAPAAAGAARGPRRAARPPRRAGRGGRRADVGPRRPDLRDGDPRPLPPRRPHPPRRGAAGARRRAGRGRAPARRRRRGRRRRLQVLRRPPQPRRRLLLEVRPAADAAGGERGADRAAGQRHGA